MIVVLDTTETFNDLRLDGTNFKLLKKYLHDTSSKLAIPRVVFEETVNHFREKLNKAVDAFETSERDLKKLVTTPELSALAVPIDQAAELQNFRAQLEEEINRLSGEVVEFDVVAIASLVERSLQRRKPFDSDGRKGFRDAIIWETILRKLIEPGPAELEVVFLTKNSADFGQDQQLAKDLQQDCRSVGKPETCVRLVNGLKSFIDAEVKPHLETLDTIQTQLQDGAYKVFDVCEFFHTFSDSIERKIREKVKRCHFERLTRKLAGDFRTPELKSIESKYSDYEVVDVWSLEDGQVAVAVGLKLSGEIECVEGRELMYPHEDEVFSDWFEDEFVGDAEFALSVTVILEKESGDLHDYEVNEIEITLGTRWPYPEYD
jgi:hypothetical protein